MGVKFVRNVGWFISQDEIVDKCTHCFKEIDMNDCFRCETTHKLTCRKCTETMDFRLCGMTVRKPEHHHINIRGILEEEE